MFGSEKYVKILSRIKYLIRLKRDISCVVSYNYAKIKIDSDDNLPLEKTLNMYNILILIKSVFNKNHNHYYYQKFLEICLCKLANNGVDENFLWCYNNVKIWVDRGEKRRILLREKAIEIIAC